MVARALFSFQVRAAGFLVPKFIVFKMAVGRCALRDYMVLYETIFEYRALCSYNFVYRSKFVCF
jgi:hypothetical protein